MENFWDSNLGNALTLLLFLLPAFAVAIGCYFYYRKNGYVADKIVDGKEKWMYKKFSAKRLGKKWRVGSFVLATVFLVMAGINFFVDDFAVNHFMLFVASPIMMVIFTLYMILLIVMNRKRDDEEERS